MSIWEVNTTIRKLECAEYMFKPFAVLADIAQKCSGFVLHGEPVNVKLLSVCTAHKTFTGNSLVKAEFAISVSDEDQQSLLDTLDNCRRLIADYNGFFDTRFSDVSCSVSPRGVYCYVMKWSCMMSDGGE